MLKNSIFSKIMALFACLFLTMPVFAAKNVSIFLNHSSSEKSTDSVLLMCALAIKQKAAPVITSKQFLKILCRSVCDMNAMQSRLGDAICDEVKQSFKQCCAALPFIEEIKKQPPHLASAALEQQDIQDLISRKDASLDCVGKFFLMTLVSDLFDNKKWIVLEREHSDLVVLIPKNSMPSDIGTLDAVRAALQQNDSAMIIRVQDALGISLCGAKILDDIQNLSPATFEKRDITAHEIVSCLVNGSGVWNILLMGHSSYSFKRNDRGVLQHCIQYVPTIAGLVQEQFQLLMHTLNTQFVVKTFSYRGCYAGGQNSLLMFTDEATGQPLRMHFDVIGLCSTNYPVLITLTDYVFASFDASCMQLNLFDIMDRVNTKVERFFHSREYFTALAAYTTTGATNDLCKAIQAVTPAPDGRSVYKKITYLPRIRCAYSDHFVPCVLPHVAEKVLYCTDNQFPSAMNEGVVELIVLDHVCAIVCNTSYITTKLNIRVSEGKKSPLFISDMPLEAVHIFDNVNVNVDTQSFFESSFFSHSLRSSHIYDEVPFSQLFCIKRLETVNAVYEYVVVFYDACHRKVVVVARKNSTCFDIGIRNLDQENVEWFFDTPAENVVAYSRVCVQKLAFEVHERFNRHLQTERYQCIRNQAQMIFGGLVNSEELFRACSDQLKQAFASLKKERSRFRSRSVSLSWSPKKTARSEVVESETEVFAKKVLLKARELGLVPE